MGWTAPDGRADDVTEATLDGTDLRGATLDRAIRHQTRFGDARLDADTDLRNVYAHDCPGRQPADCDGWLARRWMDFELLVSYPAPRRWRDDDATDPERAVRVNRKL